MATSAVKVLNRSCGLYLLDGFDELGSQPWSVDEVKLRALRAQALKGVRDVITTSKKGCLIAGREHYFSSREEMITSLGLIDKETVILHVNEEFTIDETEAYFKAAEIILSLPQWLPRRPLICQTIAQLDSDDISRMFSERDREAEFWNYFIEVVCKRDARISLSFDAETIMRVYVELARKSRNKPMNVGPFSQRDLQDAFEAAVGQPPAEDASVMLQRLPSLGRIGAESTDRQFIDMYILDGLRGRDVARIPELTEDSRRNSLNELWMNPLGLLGQRVVAETARHRFDDFNSLLHRVSTSRNAILAADIASSLFHCDNNVIDFGNVTIKQATFGDLDFTLSDAANLTITDSIIERLVLPDAPPRNTFIRSSSAGSVAGASAKSGLPSWVGLDSVDEFDSIENVSRIRNAGLSSAHEILVVIIKKTFFQKGAGRKEEALLRGFGSGSSQKTANKILNILIRDEILTSFKGDQGTVYAPVRAQAGRMNTMLTELRTSNDDVWTRVGEL